MADVFKDEQTTTWEHKTDPRKRTEQYMINGRLHTFTSVRLEGGMLRGYSRNGRDWAYLYPNYVVFDKGGAVKADKISPEI